MRRDDLPTLPPDLPVPIDDGAYDHIRGRDLPAVALLSTAGYSVRLDRLPGLVILFIYPRIGRPDVEPLGGLEGWTAVPGARGCTPEACGYRDLHVELAALGATVYGVSTQRSGEQREAAQRLHLPYLLLSDEEFVLTHRFRLPTFEYGGLLHLRRATLVAQDGTIEHVFYPCFPPDRDAERVLAWLRSR
jgi:peroxiredoxin